MILLNSEFLRQMQRRISLVAAGRRQSVQHGESPFVALRRNTGTIQSVLTALATIVVLV